VYLYMYIYIYSQIYSITYDIHKYIHARMHICTYMLTFLSNRFFGNALLSRYVCMHEYVDEQSFKLMPIRCVYM
jgi:hypothetical protein